MIWLKRLFKLFLFGVLTALILVIGFYYYIKDELPTEEVIRDVRFQIPMKVYSADGELISQFGEKRRIPLSHDEIPQTLIDALLATEDSRFYYHYGIDPIGVLKAAFDTIILGRPRGASTVTMQFARNAFLTLDRTAIRKIKEIYIALHIEQLLTKDEILTLYFNKTFFGNRAYGAGAAAQVYYGKDLKDLTLAQMATIAGLPKAPSNYNPLRYPEKSKQRRNTVLSRMLIVGAIDQETYDEAVAQPVTAKQHGAKITSYAPYVAEDVRKKIVEKYGIERAYTEGFNVYTTIDSKAQSAAQKAVKDNIHDYDERHGYRGPVTYLWREPEIVYQEPSTEEAPEVETSANGDANNNEASDELFAENDFTAFNDAGDYEPSENNSWSFEQINDHLNTLKDYDDLVPAIVTNLTDKTAYVQLKSGVIEVLDWDDLKWARPYITDNEQGPAPKIVAQIIQAGALVWLRPKPDNSYRLSQIPDVSGAFIAIDPTNGDIKASVGGYYFGNNQFDRITQAKRQIGSNIKPFVYSAALDNGYTLASLINDAPINKWDNKLGTAWRPKNSPPTYGGPTRVRRGLAQSKNVMSVRLLRSVGISRAINHMAKFGFNKSDLPRNESLSLGSAALTPISVVTAMSVFANGGYLVRNQVIDRVENSNGEILFKNTKVVAGYVPPAPKEPTYLADSIESIPEEESYIEPAPRVISAANAFLIADAMNDTIWGGGSWANKTGWNGTAWKAQSLRRRDLSGKTGTTNDAIDTWFTGFNSKITATSWLGFDEPGRPLGSVQHNSNLGDDQTKGGESGAKSALPAWIAFMKEILPSIPVSSREIPEGLISVRIDEDTGLLSRKTDYTSQWEYFIKGTEPTKYTDNNSPIRLNKDQIKEDDELF